MIKLVPFSSADFQTFISWIDSEALLITIAGYVLKYPLDEEQLSRYVNDPKSMSYSVVDTDENKTIGHCEIIFNGDGSCKLDKVLIGDKSNRGKGHGLELMRQLTAEAFSHLGIESVELNVFDWNKGAIKIYEKLGFVFNIDRSADFELNGQVWKALNMSIDKDTWLNSN